MNNDLVLGFLLAIPVYGIVLLLFKDIIVGGFIKNLISNSTTEIVNTNPGELFSTPEFKDAVEHDLLSSYKLLLVLKEEFKFLRDCKGNSSSPLDKKLQVAYNEKVKELEYTISNTERIFKEMGNDTYAKIRDEIDSQLKNRTLF